MRAFNLPLFLQFLGDIEFSLHNERVRVCSMHLCSVALIIEKLNKNLLKIRTHFYRRRPTKRIEQMLKSVFNSLNLHAGLQYVRVFPEIWKNEISTKLN